MARPRKTPGDRLVERLEASMGEAFNGGGFKWSPDEVERLELIRATADELAVLESAWETEKANGRLMIRGSRNQDVVNPLVAEMRAQRAQLDRLVSKMVVESGPVMSASERGRHAANARHNPPPMADVRAIAAQRWGNA